MNRAWGRKRAGAGFGFFAPAFIFLRAIIFPGNMTNRAHPRTAPERGSATRSTLIAKPGWKQLPRHLAFGVLRLTEPRFGAVRGCARIRGEFTLLSKTVRAISMGNNQ